MKKIIGLIVVTMFTLFSGCTEAPDLEAEKVGIISVLDQISQAYRDKDPDLAINTLAPDSDMVNFIPSKSFKSREAFVQLFREDVPAFDSTRIVVKDRVIKVHSSGSVAWFSEFWDFRAVVQGKPIVIDGFRLTGVLEKKNGAWRVVQSHSSIPVS